MRAACYGESLALSLAGAALCNLRHRHTRSWWERRSRLAYGWHAMERDGQLVRPQFCCHSSLIFLVVCVASGRCVWLEHAILCGDVTRSTWYSRNDA
jgi:hypothetical protein